MRSYPNCKVWYQLNFKFKNKPQLKNEINGKSSLNLMTIFEINVSNDIQTAAVLLALVGAACCVAVNYGGYGLGGYGGYGGYGLGGYGGYGLGSYGGLGLNEVILVDMEPDLDMVLVVMEVMVLPNRCSRNWSRIWRLWFGWLWRLWS